MRNDAILETFARKVKGLRKKKGWTQEELGRRADLHRTYIGSIERHERNVTLLNLASIAKALGVKARELI
ncbi:MAG: helix-turn-helix domain-containing protein [Planctomycetota bacterium]|jgi:transcriptional regulator with XRE-family HTH domain